MTLPRIIILAFLVLAACPAKDSPGDSADDETTAAGETTGAPTTGDESSSILCQQACAHLEACGGDSIYFTTLGLGACVSLCERAALMDTDFCRSSVVDLYTCLRDASCAEVGGVPSGACRVPNADYSISCAGCPAYSDEPEGDECAATADCVHAYTVDFECVGDTCRCIYSSYADEPSVEFANCPAADVCAADGAAIYAAAEACCDMPFVPYDLGP